jgi:hypothetical protein
LIALAEPPLELELLPLEELLEELPLEELLEELPLEELLEELPESSSSPQPIRAAPASPRPAAAVPFNIRRLETDRCELQYVDSAIVLPLSDETVVHSADQTITRNLSDFRCLTARTNRRPRVYRRCVQAICLTVPLGIRTTRTLSVNGCVT